MAKWTGADDEFWNAVAIANDPDAEERDSIAAALLLQEILMLAQDTLTKPTGNGHSSVPARVIAPPRPGDIVTDVRAVELFADGWILRPVEPSKASAMSAVRDYRVENGQLEFNAGYPPAWKASAGTISDCPQWQVICQQTPEKADGRASRTSVRNANRAV